MAFTSRRYGGQHAARFTPATVEYASLLLGRTPAPHRIRLVGTLDGIEASTQRFSILLDTGEKIVGVFGDESFDAVQRLWTQRVLVLGTAVYRASGRLLRIDAERVTSGESEKPIWSRMPQPASRRFDISRLRRSQGRRSGSAAIMGRWPGDETDEQIKLRWKGCREHPVDQLIILDTNILVHWVRQDRTGEHLQRHYHLDLGLNARCSRRSLKARFADLRSAGTGENRSWTRLKRS